MNQNYELYFILNPELTSDKSNKVIEGVTTQLKDILQAENINVDQEGLKNLAYPINKHWSGFYVNITFDVAKENVPQMTNLEKKLNLYETVIRYIVVNQTEYLVQKGKENLSETEMHTHRDLNKGRAKKTCLSTHKGLRAIDYKDIDYINQFTSPYAKIFGREKTGTSAKFQRKITQAVKRARHMGLMPFTTKHYK